MKLIHTCILFVIALSYSHYIHAQCGPGEQLVQVNIIPDNWGSEITWQVTGAGGLPVYASGGPYTDNNTTPINVNVCVDTGVLVIFTINDAYGDGICCSQGNGSYTVTSGGSTVASGGSFTSTESTIILGTPLAYDAMAVSVLTPFPLVATSETPMVSGKLMNVGATTITSLSLSYQAGTEPPVTETFSSLNISTFGEYVFEFSALWTPTNTGSQVMRIWINDINSGNADMSVMNDTTALLFEVYQGIVTPNILDDYLLGPPTYSTIATASDQLNKPTDLDFYPNPSRNELWVISEEDVAGGGTTITISDPGLPTQSSLFREDANNWHFMSLPTALAFGTNCNWANSPGVFDANHNGTEFTGPSLWSGDLAVYAQPSGGNGSHLDMLHESPYSMGIAHHDGNAYWLFDGQNGNIVFYDFKEDHGPGNSNHDDGIIRRYSQVTVTKDGDVPSHLILNKANGWLYIVDNGADRVIRMNTATGTVQSALTGFENIAEYSQMTGAVQETVIDTGLTRPSGIDLVDDRMIVGDYTTGDIRFYDISVNPALYLGKISTGAAGLTGIKVGPNGNIWYTNRLLNEVKKATPSVSTGIEKPVALEDITVFPNPATNQVNVRFPASFDTDAKVQIIDALGRTIISTTLNAKTQMTFNCSDWSAGVYVLNVTNGKQVINKTINVR